ncbi:hypothetical protein CHS0354_002103 [Potamilus streckersoni]|uniref:Mono(ADP-ribosyl)transferase n=1 Tax=Potamilus streckersoni TaxID=2493646 RepID=A0AAE0SU27_9BIVA|nr:hypothetical protein CHS0354_002103 [Potamilus streckersoni]
MTATELARAYCCDEIITVLLSKRELNFSTEAEEINTFQPWHVGFDLRGLGLIPITLAAYKNTFHPKHIDPSKSIMTVLGDIFNDLNTSENRWEEVCNKICDSLYVVNQNPAAALTKCANRKEFYQSIIKTYTIEETYFYTQMNTALRRQEMSGYKPSANDLAMGPYIVMYQILLLFWSDLGRENLKTYRRMQLTEKDMKKYQVGVKFTWVSFVSSSVEVKNAVAFPTCKGVVGEYVVTFTIDNTANSNHQPRDIEMFAMYMERERVYPAGAKFIVTNTQQRKGEMQVDLKLLDS